MPILHLHLHPRMQAIMHLHLHLHLHPHMQAIMHLHPRMQAIMHLHLHLHPRMQAILHLHPRMQAIMHLHLHLHLHPRMQAIMHLHAPEPCLTSHAPALAPTHAGRGVPVRRPLRNHRLGIVRGFRQQDWKHTFCRVDARRQRHPVHGLLLD